MTRKLNDHKALRWGIVLAMTMLYWSCGGDNPFLPEERGENEIWIQSDGFNPRTLTVSAGTTVTWINKDDQDHTVDSGTPGNSTIEFTSPTLKPQKRWSHTFSKKGTFDYFCSIHRRTGRVIVQ